MDTPYIKTAMEKLAAEKKGLAPLVNDAEPPIDGGLRAGNAQKL